MYFIVYTVILIITVWVLQIVFLDSFYQKIRYETLLKTGNELTELTNMKTSAPEDMDLYKNNTDKRIHKAIEASEAGIFTYLVHEEAGNEVSGTRIIAESIYNSNIQSPDDGEEPPQGVNFKKAIDSFESAEKIKQQGFMCDYIEDNAASTKHCIYISKVRIPDGEYYLMLISSNKALAETITLIQFQLVIVTIIVILLSFILAWAISTKLSEPIQRMSATAKQWAEGDNSVVFRGRSYDELNELAEALNYAKEGISKTGKLQRDLLANVSHDLKTPLTMIKAYAEMIRDISGENKQKRDIHTNVIIDEADRLTMLVNDILDLSKLQNDSSAPKFETVNLSELVERVIYRFANFMESAGYKIINDIDGDLFTECDEQRIEQVVYNLIGNSLNYTGEDKTITVHLHRKKNILLLEIIDSGKGISAEQIDGIWEKYYRFSETHQRPVKGTGLGLSIVKTILQSQGFKFGVISKKDVGSNFFIEFHVMKDEMIDENDDESLNKNDENSDTSLKNTGNRTDNDGLKNNNDNGGTK